jgi:predicted ribosomally synthesized peptide with SipW-like signal peptide
MKFKTIAMTGMMSLAGLGLIGAGAHAAFTATTSSVQPITAGSLNVTLSTTVAGAGGNGTATLTFPTFGPTGSTFVVADPVTITNNSNIPVTEVAIQLTDPNKVANGASAALDTETWACFYSDGELLYNEAMPTVEGYGNVATLGPIGAGGTDTYTIVFYAGDNGASSPTCGGAFSGWSNSPYGGFPSQYNNYETVPQAASTAPSLNSDAETGTINPTFTVTYQG